MHTSRLSLIVVSVSAALLLTSAAGAAPPAKSPAASGDAKRGEYLVTIMGCHDCHTPLKMTNHGPEPDMARALSGHPQAVGALKAPKAEGPWIWSGTGTMTAFAGPWGISYASNLTSDKTGIGIWTEEMFIKTMRTGKRFGAGRPLLPPMPWQGIGRASDADLKAIFAYLRAIPPVSNRVPEYIPPAPPAAPAPKK